MIIGPFACRGRLRKHPQLSGVFFYSGPSRSPAGACAWLLLALLALLTGSCSSLSALRPVSGTERELAERSFLHLLDRQSACSLSFDARVGVSLSAFMRSATLSGYVQAMAPADVRFVGLGPLDQPVLLFTTDGQDFQLIAVPDATVYQGAVSGETFARYAPPGMKPESFYYWLTGGIDPERLQVIGVRAAGDEVGYWFDLRQDGESSTHRVRLDAATGLLARHMLLDETGEVLVDARYEGRADGDCCLPARLVVTAPTHSVTMTFSFSECLADRLVTADDLRIAVPPLFKKVNLP